MSETASQIIFLELRLCLAFAVGTGVSWIIGLFTQKALNPLFEEMIEDRINRVSRLAAAAIATYFLWPLVMLFLSRGRGLPEILLYTPVVAVFVACGYKIARLKGNVVWQSVVWAVASLSLIGFFALLQCASYHPVGESPAFPVYRGRKVKFRCRSCGWHLQDYECNVGDEGICPKCGTSQPIPRRLEVSKKS